MSFLTPKDYADALSASEHSIRLLMKDDGVRITPLDAVAVQAWTAWPVPPKSKRIHFKWDRGHAEPDGSYTPAVEEYLHEGPLKCRAAYPGDGSRACFAVWHGDRLWGLRAGRMYADKVTGKPFIEGHFREGLKARDNPFRGMFSVVCETTYLAFGERAGCSDFRISDPLSEALASLYGEYGYRFTDPPTITHDDPYPCMVATLEDLKAALAAKTCV